MADAIPWATSAALAGGAAACWACGILSATLYGDSYISRPDEPGVGSDDAADAAAGGASGGSLASGVNLRLEETGLRIPTGALVPLIKPRTPPKLLNN